MSRTKGHNMHRYQGHKEYLAEKARLRDKRQARDPEPQEIDVDLHQGA